MKKVFIVFVPIAVFVLCAGLMLVFVLGKLVELPELPQPKFGYAGQWRRHHPFGSKEAYLPASSEVREHYEKWKPGTNDSSGRFYFARLGHAERQLNFHASTNMTHNMPLGDYHYTTVEFDYLDPTNGLYHFSWRLRGKHDPNFLRFENSERLYQLTLDNSPDKFPPSLSIRAIEGIEPWGN